MTSHLFAELTVRSITFRSRIFVSPICQYSSEEGLANDWHPRHLGRQIDTPAQYLRA